MVRAVRETLDDEWLCLVNPVAGGGRPLRQLERVEQVLRSQGIAVRWAVTTGPGHATRLAAEWAAPGRVIAVCGGDGTLHEAVNGAAGSEAVIAYLPSGTGNDLARALAIPTRAPQAAAILAGGRVVRLDAGQVNGRWFLTVAGVGFSANVADMVERRRWLGGGAAGWRTRLRGGTLPYVWQVLRLLRTYRHVPLRIWVDGEEWSAGSGIPSLLLAIGNTHCFAGGMKICPRARPDDGLLDLCLAGQLSPLQTLGCLAQVYKGRHLNHPQVRYTRGSRVEVEATGAGPEPVLVHADGQIVGQLPITVTVHPGAVRLLLPGEAAASSAPAHS